jgi:Ca2+-binding RTX toxin-like protein
VVLAGAGDDVLIGGPGDDRLYGGPGKDRLRARDGSRDLLDGGAGRDGAEAGRLDRPTRVESVSDPVVVAAGDIACDPLAGSFEAGFGTATRCRQGYTAALVESLEPDRVLVLGDVQNEDARYWKYLTSYQPTWGRFKEISHPAPGKEQDRFGGGGYRRYWGARARPQGSLWYSFDLGGWHIVSLDSNCPGPLSCDAGSAQEQWLRADLAANPAACTLTFWHEPRFSSAGQSTLSTEPLWQALYDAGAELVLSGHAQNYERFHPLNAAGRLDKAGGIRQFVVGTGGESLQGFRKRVIGSAARNARTFGVLKLTLHKRGYDWRFVPEQGKRFTDTGSASCH